MRTVGLVAALAFAAAAWGFELNCACEPANPESLKGRQCSLCAEADKPSATGPVFFLKDVNPRKPNRWLALPKKHIEGPHHLHDMPAPERTQLWNSAVELARSLWGEEWGIAYNGPNARTQCHTHLHIGKFLKAAETAEFKLAGSAKEIAVPAGVGVWIHPVGGKMHVHTGEQITETVLLR